MIELAHNFFSWWSHELKSFLPPTLRTFFLGAEERIVIDVSDSHAEIIRVRGTDRTSMSLFSLEGPTKGADPASSTDTLKAQASSVTATIPSDWVLTRTLKLPMAAETQIRSAVSYQIEQCTPFGRDEIYFDVSIQGRDRSADQLSATLYLLPRSVLDPVVNALAGRGYRPSRVGIAENHPSSPNPINFLWANERSAPKSYWPRVAAITGVAALLMMATAIWIPLHQKNQLVAKLSNQVAISSKEAQLVATLQKQIETLQARNSFVFRMKRKRPSAVELIAGLSRLLPADTWLQQLQIRQSKLEIHGYSATAPRLIQLLDNHPMFYHATFRGGVTRDQASSKDRFQLIFGIREQVFK